MTKKKSTGAQRVKLGQRGEKKVIADLKRRGATKIVQSPGSRGPADITATIGNKSYKIQVKTSKKQVAHNPSKKEISRLKSSATKTRSTPVVAVVTPAGIKYKSARTKKPVIHRKKK